MSRYDGKIIKQIVFPAKQDTYTLIVIFILLNRRDSKAGLQTVLKAIEEP